MATTDSWDCEVIEGVPNVHEWRKSAAGRQRLREIGIIDRHSLDSSSYQFIAWDGEGINLRGPNKAQAYCLFGASVGKPIKSKDATLATRDCFNKMLEIASLYKGKAIHVGFSFSYDAEMIFAGLPTKVIRALHKGKRRNWHGFKIVYHHRKYLRVTGWWHGKKTTCTIQDVFSFFGCSFVKALETYLPDLDREVFERIRDGKKNRGEFDVSELDTTIEEYWREELQCLVMLMDKMRILLHKAELFPLKWHGPANLANYLNNKHGTRKHMKKQEDTPSYVLDAAQYAYAAGRVENFMVGRLGKPAYKYDRNSAYPSAMVHLPSLAGRTWERFPFGESLRDEHDYRCYRMEPFGLYHIHYQYSDRFRDLGRFIPHPFFHRIKQGAVTFPIQTRRWAWGIEVMFNLRENKYGHGGDPVIYVSEGIELDDYDVEYPFAEWVPEMYQRRLDMKKAGLQEQLALKLGLNSLYGKMAEKRAWTLGSCGQHGYDNHGWPIGDASCAECLAESPSLPAWHQLEWAGFVTAHNRAEMYPAALLAAQRGILIAIETDAIFTSEPIPELPVSDALGYWGVDRYDDLIYLQSGMYFTLDNGRWNFHYRGIDRTSLSDGVDDETTEQRAAENVLKYLEQTSLAVRDPKDYASQALPAETTRFYGSKLAMARRNGMRTLWRRFITEPKDIRVGISQKRFHHPDFCRQCNSGNYYGDQGMHDMVLGNLVFEDGQEFNIDSYAAKLPWRKLKHEAFDWRQQDYSDTDLAVDEFDEIPLDYE